MRNHTKLRAFELADRLALLVYEHTRCLPRDEQFGLTSQMRRAGVSIACNIVEGCARESLRGPHPSRPTTDQLRQHTTLLVRRLRATSCQVPRRMGPEHVGYAEVGSSAAAGRGASGADRVEPFGHPSPAFTGHGYPHNSLSCCLRVQSGGLPGEPESSAEARRNRRSPSGREPEEL